MKYHRGPANSVTELLHIRSHNNSVEIEQQVISLPKQWLHCRQPRAAVYKLHVALSDAHAVLLPRPGYKHAHIHGIAAVCIRPRANRIARQEEAECSPCNASWLALRQQFRQELDHLKYFMMVFT